MRLSPVDVGREQMLSYHPIKDTKERVQRSCHWLGERQFEFGK